MDEPGITPREFCLLLMAVARQPPRLSRDLEPDLIGIDAKHRILAATATTDPPPAEFERALLESAAGLDLPAGLARGVCSDIMLEWRMAHASPEFVPWMRREAAAPPGPRRKRREERERDAEMAERTPRDCVERSSAESP